MGGMCEIPIPVEFNCEVVVVDGSRADELDVGVGVIFADFQGLLPLGDLPLLRASTVICLCLVGIPGVRSCFTVSSA